MSYKVGDKVLFDGEVYTILTFDDIVYMGTKKTIYAIEKDGVVTFVTVKRLKQYKTAHELLIEDGWEEVDNKIYEKYDEETRRLMGIMICNDKYGKYISFSHYTYVDLKLSRILTQYLEEME